MNPKIEKKYEQIEVIYISAILTALSSKWGLTKRHIREQLIAKNKLSESQEAELIQVLDKQIEFQKKIKEIEIKHFEKL